jgi:endonuclease/exonuclease/phosphatase family metal-dependent hydrolase
VLFQPEPARGVGGPVDRIAIVSWNIHEGSGDVHGVLARLRRGEFTAGEPIDQIVLLLQEATRAGSSVPAQVARGAPVPGRIAPHRGAPDADVQRFAEEGYAVLYAPSMRNGDGPEDRGNAIVSTLPLSDPRVVELPLERQRRAVVAATVDGRTSSGDAWRLNLVDVHLDTALAWTHGGPGAARGRQAAALVDALHATANSSPTAIVVAGDLNTWMGERERAVRLLSEAFGPPISDSEPTWAGPFGLHARLDHIFVSGRVSADRVTRLPSPFGSDHYGLLTRLRF